MGGMLAAVERGWVQREIQESAFRYQQAVEHKERIVVGVNEFTTDRDSTIPIHTLDLMPPVVQAVEAYATVGEIADAFRRVHGEYREPCRSDRLVNIRTPPGVFTVSVFLSIADNGVLIFNASFPTFPQCGRAVGGRDRRLRSGRES